MLSVITAWQKAGGYSSALVKSLDEGDHFLSMEPYVVRGFQHPNFILRQRHEVRTVSADGQHFWQRLEHDSLVSAGFEIDGIPNVQREFLAQKITLVGEAHVSYASAVTAFRDLFAPATRVGHTVHESVEVDVAMCNTLISHVDACDAASIKDLDRVLKKLDTKVLAAFTLCASGNLIVQAADKHLQTWSGMCAAVTIVERCASALSDVIGSHAVDDDAGIVAASNALVDAQVAFDDVSTGFGTLHVGTVADVLNDLCEYAIQTVRLVCHPHVQEGGGTHTNPALNH